MAILLSYHPSIEPPVTLLGQLPVAEYRRVNEYLLHMRLKINRDALVPGHLKDRAYESVSSMVNDLALNRAFSRASSGDPVINYSRFYRRNITASYMLSIFVPFEPFTNGEKMEDFDGRGM